MNSPAKEREITNEPEDDSEVFYLAQQETTGLDAEVSYDFFHKEAHVFTPMTMASSTAPGSAMTYQTNGSRNVESSGHPTNATITAISPNGTLPITPSPIGPIRLSEDQAKAELTNMSSSGESSEDLHRKWETLAQTWKSNVIPKENPQSPERGLDDNVDQPLLVLSPLTQTSTQGKRTCHHFTRSDCLNQGTVSVTVTSLPTTTNIEEPFRPYGTFDKAGSSLKTSPSLAQDPANSRFVAYTKMDVFDRLYGQAQVPPSPMVTSSCIVKTVDSTEHRILSSQQPAPNPMLSTSSKRKTPTKASRASKIPKPSISAVPTATNNRKTRTPKPISSATKPKPWKVSSSTPRSFNETRPLPGWKPKSLAVVTPSPPGKAPLKTTPEAAKASKAEPIKNASSNVPEHIPLPHETFLQEKAASHADIESTALSKCATPQSPISPKQCGSPARSNHKDSPSKPWRSPSRAPRSFRLKCDYKETPMTMIQLRMQRTKLLKRVMAESGAFAPKQTDQNKRHAAATKNSPNGLSPLPFCSTPRQHCLQHPSRPSSSSTKKSLTPLGDMASLEMPQWSGRRNNQQAISGSVRRPRKQDTTVSPGVKSTTVSSPLRQKWKASMAKEKLRMPTSEEALGAKLLQLCWWRDLSKEEQSRARNLSMVPTTEYDAIPLSVKRFVCTSWEQSSRKEQAAKVLQHWFVRIAARRHALLTSPTAKEAQKAVTPVQRVKQWHKASPQMQQVVRGAQIRKLERIRRQQMACIKLQGWARMISSRRAFAHEKRRQQELNRRRMVNASCLRARHIDLSVGLKKLDLEKQRLEALTRATAEFKSSLAKGKKSASTTFENVPPVATTNAKGSTTVDVNGIYRVAFARRREELRAKRRIRICAAKRLQYWWTNSSRVARCRSLQRTASSKIQAAYRGHRVYDVYHLLLISAVTIQNWWRSMVPSALRHTRQSPQHQATSQLQKQQKQQQRQEQVDTRHVVSRTRKISSVQPKEKTTKLSLLPPDEARGPEILQLCWWRDLSKQEQSRESQLTATSEYDQMPQQVRQFVRSNREQKAEERRSSSSMADVPAPTDVDWKQTANYNHLLKLHLSKQKVNVHLGPPMQWTKGLQFVQRILFVVMVSVGCFFFVLIVALIKVDGIVSFKHRID